MSDEKKVRPWPKQFCCEHHPDHFDGTEECFWDEDWDEWETVDGPVDTTPQP